MGERDRIRHDREVDLIRRAAASAPGSTDPELRRAVHEGAPLPAPLDWYIQKVRTAAWSVNDDDVAALVDAGYSQDAIVELTITAAAAEAGRRWDAALRAMRGGA
jgi:alkylhydroperoxidase family enzyme